MAKKTNTRFQARLRDALAALVAAILLSGIAVGPANAEFGLEQPGGLSMTSASTQAGVHADLVTHFGFNRLNPTTPDGTVSEMKFTLPPGLVGNAEALPRCEMAQVLEGFMQAHQCPMNTAVGMIELEFSFPGSGFSGLNQMLIYNVKPYNDEPAAFAFSVMAFPVRLDTTLLPGDDYRVQVQATGREELYLLKGDVTFWGVPSEHTAEEGPFQDTTTGRYFGNPDPHAARIPFMANPTSCPGTPQSASMALNSWQNPAKVLFEPITMTPEEGCEFVPFEPSMTASADTHRAGVPAGYDFDLEIPQIETPKGRVVSHLKDATVTLPEGTAFSPGIANGLSACSDAEMQIGTEDPASCPSSSKVGRAILTSPLLPAPVNGDVYVGEQEGRGTYRIMLLMRAYGLEAKIEGKVSPDPKTGRLTTTFLDNPQLPFSKLHLEFKGGPNAALVNPSACGPATTEYKLSGWSGAVVSGTSSFQVEEGCAPRGFAPRLGAGAVNPVAGKASPFTLRVIQGEGEQNVSRIDATLPKGELAKLAGVQLCGDAQAASGDCPPGSRIGRATVGVGQGASPLYVPQPGKAPTALYIGGPYKGAPYSLVAKVPAQAGPFDLGTVSVRSAIQVDPVTAQVSVKSDPLPQILEGIPLSYRDIRVEIDRPGFMINPTSCDPMSVTSQLVSAAGSSADPTSRFQVGDCGSLGFKPKLAMRLFGPTNRNAHPKFRATLTARPGDANIGRVSVTLPKTEFLENAHIRTICTRVQYAAKACPPQSVYGYAKAWTPLLDQPLEGPVYLRSSNHELPDLVASLDGAIHIDLDGRIDSINGRIRSTFEAVPDAPVSKFVLSMQGGKKGLLVNNTEVCNATPRANVLFDAQSGKTHDTHPVLGAACGKGKKK